MENPDWQKIIEMGSGPKGQPKLSMDDCKLLWESAMALEVRCVVEIGAFWGTSTMLLGLACLKTGGHIWSVESRPRREWFDNIRHMGLDKIVTLITGLSPLVRVDLPGQIDLLFIDGDHQTRSVLRDYFYWSCFVRIGGRIGFHDIYGPPSNKVNDAIEIIKKTDRSLCEIDRCPPARDCGIIIFEKICS